MLSQGNLSAIPYFRMIAPLIQIIEDEPLRAQLLECALKQATQGRITRPGGPTSKSAIHFAGAHALQ